MKKGKAIIREFLSANVLGDEPCERISLHMTSSRGDALLSRKVKPGDFEGANFEALIDEVLALVDSDEDEDIETYCLKATYEGGDVEKVSRPITTASTGKDIHKALLAQSHKHIEVLMRGIGQMLDSNARYQTRRTEIELEGLEKYGELRQRMLLAEQENADRSHERQLEAKREERHGEWIDMGMKAAIGCMPMLMGKATGINPQGADAIRSSPQYQTLRTLFESQPEENWPNIAVWIQQVPLENMAERAAFKMVIDSVLADIDQANKEKKNGKTEAEPPIRH